MLTGAVLETDARRGVETSDPVRRTRRVACVGKVLQSRKIASWTSPTKPPELKAT